MFVHIPRADNEGYRYGPMCWGCRAFYQRLRGICSTCGDRLCNACAAKHEHR
jgi:rRNA maturation endonuclease Nob1